MGADGKSAGNMKGLELSERFYWEAVRPLLDQYFERLEHAAALLGDGSEVLGYDDAMSTDHHWGPRALLFVRPDMYDQVAEPLHAVLAAHLPRQYRGFSTNFTLPNPSDHGVQLLEEIEEGPINHRVEVLTFAGFVRRQLNFDLAQPLTAPDWLSFSEQRLLSITGGKVFYDSIGLQEARSPFACYPRDVWLYLLAAAWTRIGQEEHLMGRAGLVGDEVGSALIGARLVRDVMRLCFLMERTYAPYAKWFGTAFRRLNCGQELYGVLLSALSAQSWQAREAHLCTAYEYLARRHNELGLTQPMPQETQTFFGRPLRVIALHGFAEALVAQIRDPEVMALTQGRLVGSIDLISDNVDFVEDLLRRPWLRQMYEMGA
jgi:hypothetical protein